MMTKNNPSLLASGARLKRNARCVQPDRQIGGESSINCDNGNRHAENPPSMSISDRKPGSRNFSGERNVAPRARHDEITARCGPAASYLRATSGHLFMLYLHSRSGERRDGGGGWQPPRDETRLPRSRNGTWRKRIFRLPQSPIMFLVCREKHCGR